jgi:hypothetical protein
LDTYLKTQREPCEAAWKHFRVHGNRNPQVLDIKDQYLSLTVGKEKFDIKFG